MVQLFTGDPSTWTTQTPQLDVSQPQWVPVRPSSSRRKCTSRSLGSISRVYSTPLTLTVTCISRLLSAATGDSGSQGSPDGFASERAFVVGRPPLVGGRLTFLRRHSGGQVDSPAVSE